MGRKKKQKFKKGDIFISKNRTPFEELAEIYYELEGFMEDGDEDSVWYIYHLRVMCNNPDALRNTMEIYKRKVSEDFRKTFQIETGDWLIETVSSTFQVNFINDFFVSDDKLKTFFIKIPKQKLKEKRTAFSKILSNRITLVEMDGDKK